MSRQQTVHITNGCVSLDDAGFVEVSFKRGAHPNLEDAREVVDAVDELTGRGRKAPLLVNLARQLGHSPEARSYYADNDRANELVCKVGLLAESLVAQVLGNSYVKIKNPRPPTRLFRNREEAISWLTEPGA